MPPLLNDIALFIEVVNTGSFTQAAERFDMPASTLSRRIAALERKIGFKLLNRTTRRVEPTAEGQAYHRRCQPLIEEAMLAHEAIAENRHSATGVLRLSCTSDFAHLYLCACIKKYLELYPRVSVELTLSSRTEDLLVDQLDMAIRLGPMRDAWLVAHSLGALQPSVYANPRWLHEQAPVQHPSDLSNRACIRLGGEGTSSQWAFSRGTGGSTHENVKVAINGRVAAGGPKVAAQLAVLGLGIAMLERRLAQPWVESGDLVELLTDWRPAAVQVHAITLSRLVPARVRHFIELLKEELV